MHTIEHIYPIFSKSSGVCTDTRLIRKNEFFIALKGDRFDGNDYALTALQSGALAALVDRIDLACQPNCWYVPNALTAMQKLAHHHRSQFQIPVLAITGTNGKTTTKELVNSVLSQKFRTVATQGNLNNHIGVPLTLLSIKPDTEAAIIEMGANHPGEIAWLCQIAAPNLGLVTNVGRAHLEGFGTIEQIWDTKMALYRYLEASEGTVFIHQNEPSLRPLKEVVFSSSIRFDQDNMIEPVKAVTFSSGHHSILVHLSEFNSDHQPFEVALYGVHNYANILAAIAFGLYFKLSISELSSGLRDYRSTQNRSQILVKGTNTYYLDAYNANPSSVILTLRFFDELKRPEKVVILGDMKELGAETLLAHLEVIKALQLIKGLKKILLVGPHFKEALGQVTELDARFISFDDVFVAKSFLEKCSYSNTDFLLKGSRSIGLERIL